MYFHFEHLSFVAILVNIVVLQVCLLLKSLLICFFLLLRPLCFQIKYAFGEKGEHFSQCLLLMDTLEHQM